MELRPVGAGDNVVVVPLRDAVVVRAVVLLPVMVPPPVPSPAPPTPCSLLVCQSELEITFVPAFSEAKAVLVADRSSQMTLWKGVRELSDAQPTQSSAAAASAITKAQSPECRTSSFMIKTCPTEPQRQ